MKKKIFAKWTTLLTKFRFENPKFLFEKPEVLVRKPEVSVRKPEVSVRKPEVSVKNPEVSVKNFELETSVKVVFRNASVAKTRNFELLCLFDAKSGTQPLREVQIPEWFKVTPK
jgi:hypothetical protein